MTYTLGQRIVRTAGLFQGLVALPIMAIMGWEAFMFIFWYSNSSIYYFVKVLFVSNKILLPLFLPSDKTSERDRERERERERDVCAHIIFSQRQHH